MLMKYIKLDFIVFEGHFVQETTVATQLYQFIQNNAFSIVKLNSITEKNEK